MKKENLRRSNKRIRYDKWGYLFLLPFFIVFVLFTLFPLAKTFLYSFQRYFDDQLETVGPFWCGIENYRYIFTSGASDPRSIILFDVTLTTDAHISSFLYYLMNTIVIWILGFVPQIALSLFLAVCFTNTRLKIKGQAFWKTVIYMPNLIMAAAFGMLFYMIFAQNGPVINTLAQWGWIDKANVKPLDSDELWTHLIIAGLNCLMWFGNTTLLLMSGVMGIDPSIYESASIDGAGPQRTFWQITMPLLRPIFLYVFITSMIGGIQLFDVAQVYTQTTGGMLKSSETVMMYLFNLVTVKHNYGQAGALSVILFFITFFLSVCIYLSTYKSKNMNRAMQRAKAKRLRSYRHCSATQEEIARLAAAKGE